MQDDVVKLAPSILAAFARLGEQVTEAEKVGADRIHVDVKGGHFVPNLSMGAPVVQPLRRTTQLPLETHVMISNPDLFFDEFVAAGSDSFLVHWEGNNNLHRIVQRIKELGKRAAINPATPAGVWKRSCPIGQRTMDEMWMSRPRIDSHHLHQIKELGAASES